jgi:tyrosyl-tRNA synthetase
MQSKKDLARIIVKDFHSQEAAEKSEEDWAKQFQKGDVPEEIEEIRVKYEDIRAGDIATDPLRIPGVGSDTVEIRLDRLLVICGLADSVSDAVRKLNSASVKCLLPTGESTPMSSRTHSIFNGSSIRLVLRVGKRIKAAVIEI